MSDRVWLAALLATGAAVPAAASSYIDSTSSYYTGDAVDLVNATGFDFKPLNFTPPSVSVGGISHRVGAKITASVAATFEVEGGLSFTNTIGQIDSGQLHTLAYKPLGSNNNTFVLTDNFSKSSAQTFVGAGAVDASLSATAYAGANIYGKACLGVCLSGTIVNVGIGQPQGYDILDYHSATNSVTFLNQSYANVLPQSFNSDTLPISATLQAIDVSGKTSGKTSTFFTTSQTIAGAYVDVAQAIADSFGLPNDALSGSVLGFDYTTVAAKIGAGIRATYNIITTLTNRGTIYDFSSPVQIQNVQTGQWGNPVTSELLNDGDAVVVRPVGQVASLSILPTVFTSTDVYATMKIYAELEDHIKILEVSGHGLDAGPLFAKDKMINLGNIAQFSADGGIFADTTLAPLTIDFTQAAAPLATTHGLGALALPLGGPVAGFDSAPGFVFVPDPSAAVTDTVLGKVYLAINFGSPGCNADDIERCVFDPGFTPIAEQQRTTRDATGASSFSYAVDFGTVDRFAAAPDGAYGVQGTDDTLRALIAGLPEPGGYDLGPDIAHNTTPFTASVPELATWAMLVAGFGLVGGFGRRDRANVGTVARRRHPAVVATQGDIPAA